MAGSVDLTAAFHLSHAFRVQVNPVGLLLPAEISTRLIRDILRASHVGVVHWVTLITAESTLIFRSDSLAHGVASICVRSRGGWDNWVYRGLTTEEKDCGKGKSGHVCVSG